jgi:hypothetical protein
VADRIMLQHPADFDIVLVPKGIRGGSVDRGEVGSLRPKKINGGGLLAGLTNVKIGLGPLWSAQPTFAPPNPTGSRSALSIAASLRATTMRGRDWTTCPIAAGATTT